MPWTTNLSQQRCMVNLIYNPFTPFSCFQFLSAYASAIYSTVHWLSCHGRPRDWMILGQFFGLEAFENQHVQQLNSLGDSAYAAFKYSNVTWPDSLLSHLWSRGISFSDPRDVFISVILGQAKSNSFVIMGALESDEANPSCLLLLLGRSVDRSS